MLETQSQFSPVDSWCDLPARLSADAAAKVLGFQIHDIPVLVSARVLKPLGKAKQNSVKYFATVEIEGFAKDKEWLDKATSIVCENWKAKNKRRSTSHAHFTAAPLTVAVA